MSSFVTINFPKCSICLDPFGPQDEVIGHVGDGEKHPFHKSCLQDMIQTSRAIGIQPIKCPVCQIELPTSLSSDPIQNPAPSVRAASVQLSDSPSVSPVSDEMEAEPAQTSAHWFDRLSPAEQYRILTEHFQQGVIDQTAYRDYVGVVLGRR